jgi:ABC-2 type transport system ATP-binding protein
MNGSMTFRRNASSLNQMPTLQYESNRSDLPRRYVHHLVEEAVADYTRNVPASESEHVSFVVQSNSLSKRYGEVLAVDDLSFNIESGTITGFLGPNGAGKSTTLRMLLGLAKPTSGHATLFGKPYDQLETPALRVGAVLEATDFHPGRSGRDHLRMLSRAVGLPDARVDEVLSLVELQDAAKRRVKGYSLGMRQRLGLAAALLGDPDLLVLDEPANGLDPEGVRWLRDFLRDFASGGRTVLVSSHVLAEVAQTVDQVLIINHGRLVTESTLENLTARVGGAVRVRSSHLQQLAEALEREGILTTISDEALVAQGTTRERVGDIAFATGVPIYELVTEGSSLEEIFLDLTSEEARP